MRHLLRVGLLCSLVACDRGLTLPEPPPAPTAPPPPTLSGRVVIAEPGTGRRLPIEKAVVEVLRTNLATQTNADGRFTIGPFARLEGRLALRLDEDGDGVPERQRLLDVAELAAGRTGPVEAGELLVAETAFVRGRVVLADGADVESHGGITIYVPESPFSATTAPNGSFVLRDLPDGVVDIAAFKAGYQPVSIAGVRLGPGQVLDLRELVLQPAPAAAAVSVQGRIDRVDGSAEGLTIRLERTDVAEGDPARIVAQATTAADGSYTLANVPPGLYVVVATGEGIASVVVDNVLVTGQGATLSPIQVAAGQSEVPPRGEPSGTDGGVEPRNHPPIARAADQRVRAGSVVRLDATLSEDPDDDALVFTWLQESGPDVVLDVNGSTLAARPVFTAPDAGATLSFRLRVTDPLGAFDEHVVQVVVNRLPVAVHEATIVVNPSAAGRLDASRSFDPDGAPITYRWEFVGIPEGQQPAITLDDATSATPAFTAPATAGTLVKLTLTVNDGDMDSVPLAVRVYVNGGNQPPIADAGPALELDVGQVTVLDPAASTDPDGRITQFKWLFVGTPCGTITGVNTAGVSSQANGTASFTAPSSACRGTIQLIVMDNGSATDSAELSVRVADRRPASVSSSSPSGTGAPAFGPVKVTFARDIDVDSLANAIVVRQGETVVPGAFSYDASSRTASFVPNRPFAEGLETEVKVSGVRSIEQQAMTAPHVFTFSAGLPALLAGERFYGGRGEHFIPVARGPERFVKVKPLGNCAETHRNRTGAWGHYLQMCSLGGPSDARRSFVDENFRFGPDGRPWLTHADNDCSGTGARVRIVRYAGDANPVSNSFGFFIMNYDAAGTAGFPASSCSTTRWAAAGIGLASDVWVSSIDAVASTAGGPIDSLAVRLFECPTCNEAVDGSETSRKPAAAYVEHQLPVRASGTDRLRALTMDVRGAVVALAWIEGDIGARKVRGGIFDADKRFVPMTRNGNPDLNLEGSADLPTLRFSSDGTLHIAWVRTDTLVPEVRVMRGNGTTWTDLGGMLNEASPTSERLALVLRGETPFVSWAEPAGVAKRPHLAWFDDRSGSWRFPAGTGARGEIVLSTGCVAGRAGLSLTGDGAGVLVAHAEDCGNNGGGWIRDLR